MEIRRVYRPEVIEVVTPESETFDLIGLTAEQLALVTMFTGYCAGEASKHAVEIYHAGRSALGIAHKVLLYSVTGHAQSSHTHIINRGSKPEADRIRVDSHVINNILSDRKVPTND